MCYHKSCFEVNWNETGLRSIITVIFFSITNLKVFISINVYSAIFATCYFRLSTLVNGFIPSWLRSDTVLKWIDTFSKKHTYLKTSCIYLRIVLISISLKFVGPLATRAKWTIIKRGQIIPSRYWVKQQIDIVIIDTPECFNSFSISFHVFVSQWFLIRHSSHLIRNHCRAKMILLIN